MAFLFKSFVAGQYTGQHPCYTVRQHKRRQFPAGEDIVADGNFLIDDFLNNALIHTLVMAAEQSYVIHSRQFLDTLLG